MPKKDFTQVAYDVVRRATGEVAPVKQTKRQEAGRKGGLKGGKARMDALTPAERTALAHKGVVARKKAAAGVLSAAARPVKG
jgi:hypothetical protein